MTDEQKARFIRQARIILLPHWQAIEEQWEGAEKPFTFLRIKWEQEVGGLLTCDFNNRWGLMRIEDWDGPLRASLTKAVQECGFSFSEDLEIDIPKGSYHEQADALLANEEP